MLIARGKKMKETHALYMSTSGSGGGGGGAAAREGGGGAARPAPFVVGAAGARPIPAEGGARAAAGALDPGSGFATGRGFCK